MQKFSLCMFEPKNRKWLLLQDELKISYVDKMAIYKTIYNAIMGE